MLKNFKENSKLSVCGCNFEGKDSVKEAPDILPYEKVVSFGPEGLTDIELLAVILRTGTKKSDVFETAKALLNVGRCGRGLSSLCGLTIPELTEVPGIGVVKAVQISCVVEFSRRMSKQGVDLNTRFTSPDLIAKYYMQDLTHLDTERVILLMLDSKYKFIRDSVISMGTVNCSAVSSREIFIEALKYKAVAIIILHNHPGGDPTPSKEDIKFTESVKKSAEVIGIRFLDHIIIGNNRFISLSREKLM